MVENQNELQRYINQTFNIDLPWHDEKLWYDALVDHINLLIQKDMNKLVQILYRLDVDEHKLKTLLARRTGTDAAMLIAGLLIERQKEKAIARRNYKFNDDHIADDEKW